MADCERYWALMSAALDDDLTPSDRAALDAHLAACPDCRAMWAQLCGMDDALRAPIAPPAGLTDRVMAAVDTTEQDIPFTNLPQNRDVHTADRAALKAWRKPVTTVAALAACCLLVLGVGRFVQDWNTSEGEKSGSMAYSTNQSMAAAGSEAMDESAIPSLTVDGKTYVSTGEIAPAPPESEPVTLPDGRAALRTEDALYLPTETAEQYAVWAEAA